MNRNDFYKELMSRYALDEEKIRLNAIKQAKRPGWQKFAADHWKPAVGTAAAVAVTVAAVAYTHTGAPVPEPPEPTTSVLSASQRLSEAEQNYYNVQADGPFSDIYITFSESVSYNNIIMAFSMIADPGEIKIETLYTEKNILRDIDSVREYGTSHPSEKSIIAAKVSALSVYYRDIQDLPKVYLAELGSSSINDETFSPIVIEDCDPLVNDSQSVEMTFTAPVSNVTTTPFSFGSSDNSAKPPEPVIGSSGSDGVTTLPPPGASSDSGASDDITPDTQPAVTDAAAETVPAETTPEDTVPEETVPEETVPEETVPGETASETTEPVETTTAETAPPETEIPSNEITTSAQNDPDVSLLTEKYELNVENSLETLLIGNNAVVLTKNAFYMYTFGGSGASPGCSFEMNNPKISFRNANTVILTGCDQDDVRNIVSVIDLDTDEVHSYDVSGNIGGAGIGAIHYYKAVNKYFIKSVLDGKSFVYEADISSASGIQFRPLVESDGPVSIAGCKNDLIYLVKSGENGENAKLYSFNRMSGEIRDIASFSGVMKIRRGADLESFALLNDDDSYIFDVNLGMLIAGVDVNESTELVTEGGNTCFRTGGVTYEIGSNSQAEQIYRGVVFRQEPDSDFEVSEITAGKIIVVRKSRSGSTWAG